MRLHRPGTPRSRALAVAVPALVGVLTLLAPPEASAQTKPLEPSLLKSELTPSPGSHAHPHVSLTPSRTVPVGAKVALAGTVRPSRAGQTVRLQRRVSGSWQTVAHKKLSKRSAYTFSRPFPSPGAKKFRVLVPKRGSQRQALSPTRTMTAVNPGYDVSYPQCGLALPAGATFGIVGVDGGRPYDVNPCLAGQIAWALSSGAPSYYVNTANPGPALSDHWPTGQPVPRMCVASQPDSSDCAYDYGWNAAQDAFARASTAAAAVGAPAVTTAFWWLDVELRNTWESLEYGAAAAFLANDTAALQGMADYLHAQGVAGVGVYSTAHQWQQITGGAGLARAPIWYAGTGSATTAAARCSSSYSFTGGKVLLAQFARGGFDANHRC
jgi:hypothetical protein